jgi:hypothetical protein
MATNNDAGNYEKVALLFARMKKILIIFRLLKPEKILVYSAARQENPVNLFVINIILTVLLII